MSVTCPNGGELKPFKTTTSSFVCDLCQTKLLVGAEMYGTEDGSYNIRAECYEKLKLQQITTTTTTTSTAGTTEMITTTTTTTSTAGTTEETKTPSTSKTPDEGVTIEEAAAAATAQVMANIAEFKKATSYDTFNIPWWFNIDDKKNQDLIMKSIFMNDIVIPKVTAKKTNEKAKQLIDIDEDTKKRMTEFLSDARNAYDGQDSDNKIIADFTTKFSIPSIENASIIINELEKNKYHGVVRIFETEDKLSENIAKFILEKSVEAIKQNDRFTIAFSGGNLPDLVAKGLLADGVKEKIDWGKWHFFWCDERCVAHDHEDSNYKLVKEKLLDHVAFNKDNVHAIDASLVGKPKEAAAAYEEMLKKVFPEEKVPSLDLCLLGMGPDGHTCSLFPGHKLLDEKTLLVASITDSPKPPPNRITLTYPVINASKTVAYVSTGDSLQKPLAEIRAGGSDLPSARVTSVGGVHWFVDEAAAGKSK